MPQPIDSNQKRGGLFGVRTAVWFIVCGLLLIALLAISTSRLQTSQSSVGVASRSDDSARPTPGVRPDHRVSPAADNTPPVPAEKISQGDVQSTSPLAITAISNELSAAREKLTELRGNYGEEHPDVKEQLRAIESLERSALTARETVELAKARADLARLDVRFGPRHPDLQAQGRFVESLEQSAAAGEPSDLAQAKAYLAKLRVLYGEGHPDVQAQLKKVVELQR